jgi:enamine deaminase RidA (YjgF/YER057c/UK114 family)
MTNVDRLEAPMNPGIVRFGQFDAVAGLPDIPVISRAVSYGRLIYTSGIVGEPGGDIGLQTRQALERLDALLNDAGSSKSSILSAQVWLADMKDFAEHNEVWDAWVDPINPPARACVEANLYAPDVLVEIRVTAVAESVLPQAGTTQ